MQTILILIGLPGCGKSTHARKLLASEPDRWKRINRDDIRRSIDGRQWIDDEKREAFVTKVADNMLREALSSGYDVIHDNTNLPAKVRKRIKKIAESCGDVTVIEKVFTVPVEQCLEQNRRRFSDDRVVDKVILDKATQFNVKKSGVFANIKDSTTYFPPRANVDQKKLVQDETLPQAVMCDLDGTIALTDGRGPYEEERCDEDIVNGPVAVALEAVKALGLRIIFISARHEKARVPTEKFLSEKLPEIKYETLLLRKDGDDRKDSIVKRELFDTHIMGKYNVMFVLDDRDQVCQMWRHELGLTVFQVADGNF